MKLQVGCEFRYTFPQATPAILVLNIHYSRASDLTAPDHVIVTPSVPMTAYRDSFGNWCIRLTAPAGKVVFATSARLNDSGLQDLSVANAAQVPVEALPDDAIVFLLPSRFCDSDKLLDLAWTLFGTTKPGWPRVQAICDFVHNRIAFGYEHARPTRNASEAYQEGVGVCRDYAHLAVAFCRALNIPARYCTGYLSDAGLPPPYAPGDFAAWFEAYLGGAWHTFDPRNNTPRIGRVLIARGRDAADVAMITTFGPNMLDNFKVWNEELPD
jgi:transglutaminase-like putative cysteine protease